MKKADKNIPSISRSTRSKNLQMSVQSTRAEITVVADPAPIPKGINAPTSRKTPKSYQAAKPEASVPGWLSFDKPLLTIETEWALLKSVDYLKPANSKDYFPGPNHRAQGPTTASRAMRKVPAMSRMRRCTTYLIPAFIAVGALFTQKTINHGKKMKLPCLNASVLLSP